MTGDATYGDDRTLLCRHQHPHGIAYPSTDGCYHVQKLDNWTSAAPNSTMSYRIIISEQLYNVYTYSSVERLLPMLVELENVIVFCFCGIVCATMDDAESWRCSHQKNWNSHEKSQLLIESQAMISTPHYGVGLRDTHVTWRPLSNLIGLNRHTSSHILTDCHSY